jgi:hypothetical protein
LPRLLAIDSPRHWTPLQRASFVFALDDRRQILDAVRPACVSHVDAAVRGNYAQKRLDALGEPESTTSRDPARSPAIPAGPDGWRKAARKVFELGGAAAVAASQPEIREAFARELETRGLSVR